MNENKTENQSKSSIFTWAIFIIIIALIIWGLIAAEQKSAREGASLVLPSQIVATDHVRGDANAPVTLVEYGDFQCPACEVYYPTVEQVLSSEATGTVRFVFRHFPLSQHPNAVPAALAAEAASEQGKFWEMYHILYDRQDEWAEATSTDVIFVGYAKGLGLDVAKFSNDLKSTTLNDIINNDYKGGVKGGVNSTPTFFLNGKEITPRGYEEFKKDIDDTLPKVSL